MPRDRFKGVAWILFASLSFSLMGAVVKAAAGTLSTLQIVFWRSVVIALVAHPLLRRSGLAIRPGDPRRMALRCALGLGAMLLYFASIAALPLSTATALQYTSPLFTVLLAGPLLGEAAGRRGWGLAALAFAGVLLVLRPQVHVALVPVLMGLLGAGLAGWVYVIVRQLRTTDPPTRIVWWFAVSSAALTLPFAVYDGLPATLHEWSLAVGLGLLATGGQMGMTLAYRFERATIIGPLSYLTVILSALWGILWFGDAVEALSWVGLAIFLIAGALTSAGAGR